MTPDAADAAHILRRHADATNAALARLIGRLRDRTDAPPKIVEAVAYSLLDGGKLLRPALVLEIAAALGPSREKPNPSALAAACAIELIHTFSLVHDDLPAMDDDALRRGRPTNHVVYGEATAVLAGDAMVTLAFEVLATDADPAAVPALVKELAVATGPAGMIGGQILDLEGEKHPPDFEGLKRIHRLKTGALLVAAARLGAISARAPEAALAAVTAYAQHLGLAFQIVDDLLDVTATPEQLGKATNKDAARGKSTYPGLLGEQEARRHAAVELAAALAAVEPLGPPADGLRALARFVVDRDR